MSDRDQACENRIQAHLDSTLDDLRRLWSAYCDGDEDGPEDLGNLYEYGLSFDYVPPGTFTDQDEGYMRYQLSWGGPSDEFRIFINPDLSAHRIEYWFLDWFDGASRTLYGDDLALLDEIYSCFFVDSGTARYQLDAALEQ